MFEKLLRGISKISEILAAILLAIMCSLVFTNVVCRYAFHYSIPWSEELSRFLQIWIVFIGTALVYKEDNHLGLDILVKVLPRQVARAIAIIVDCTILYLAYLIALGGLQLTVSMRGWMAPASGLSYSWKFCVTIFSMALIVVFGLIKLYWHVMSLIKNQDLPLTSDNKKYGGEGA